MAKKRRRRRQEDEPQVENRRETRLRARARERNLRLTLIVGGVVGLALLLVIFGAVNELLVKPNSALAKVEGETIVTRDFWKRARLRQSDLENQRLQLQAFAQQFGDSSLFASQISSINATLASPLSLGTQVLNDMIEEAVLRIKASELGVSVADAEVNESLREEVARGQGALTQPQATATAEAAIDATTTAESFTPTPLPTSTPTTAEQSNAPLLEKSASAGSELTETVDAEIPAELPTPEPPTVLTDTLYQEGLRALEENLQARAGMSLADYRGVLRARLMRTKMTDKISQEQVSTTEEQVRTRHILISVDPEPEPAAEAEEPAEDAAPDTANEAAPVKASDGESEIAAENDEATAEDEPESSLPAAEGIPDTNNDGRVDNAEALAFAQMLRQRILDGEDFGELAMQYSDDPGSGSQGGNLGWAGRGRYVPEFDEAAFTLAVGEISQPIKTTFGYHIIELLDRDDERPKDENSLRQEYTQAFQTWLQEQVLTLEIDRPDNLSSLLPQDLSRPAGR